VTIRNAPFDVAIIGAGAAGMMCAATAGQRGRRVLLIDHYNKVGEKIRISGGGRCNFTNLHATHADFLSSDPAFCRPALERYKPRDFIALVESHRIAWHEKTLGQLFCDRSAMQIIEMLKAECAKGRVEWWQPCAISDVRHDGNAFRLETARSPVIARSLVIATGGLTVPKIGATPFAYKVAEQFGLAVVPPRPALVPLGFEPQFLERFAELSGVSVDVEARCDGGRFRENLLFTHRGLSGPAILQVSSYWQHARAAEPIRVDLLPGVDVKRWLSSQRRSRALLSTLLAQRMPRRVAQQWCAAHELDGPIAELSDETFARAVDALTAWKLQPSGTLGYNKAEVTLGGVDTRGLSPDTMEARNVKGLYFIGEAVDVTGHLGGFNFQWAWSSARAAGASA
jgi:predicted Rossmann fold flavoprotein